MVLQWPLGNNEVVLIDSSNKGTDAKDLFCYSIPVQSEKQFFSQNNKIVNVFTFCFIYDKTLKNY